MSRALLQALADELAVLLAPVRRAAEGPDARARLLAELGVVSDDNDAELLASLQAVNDAGSALRALADQDDPSFDTVLAALDASERAFTLVRALAGGDGPAPELPGLGRDLADLLVAAWLSGRHPVAREVAALLTLMEPAEDRAPTPPLVVNGAMVRAPVAIDRFRLARIVDLLRDPVATLRAAYVNDLRTDEDAHAVADKLFRPLFRLLRDCGVPCRYGITPGDEPLLGDAAPLMSHALIVYVDDELNGAPAEAGVVLTVSPADRGDLGLVVTPFGSIATERSAGSWALGLHLTAGVDALAYGRHGFTLLAGSDSTEVSGSIVGTLASPDDGPAAVVGNPEGVRLLIGGARLALETSLSTARQELAVSADLSPATLVIAPADADGFLASLLPPEGLRAGFDLGIGWSSEHGITFRGHAGLEATIPVGRSVAGLTVTSLHLRLAASEGLVVAEVSVSLAASIGLVRTLVERFGVQASVTFPEQGGNVGVADLALGIRPPRGIGIVVDSGAVTGGGFLFHDAENSQYAGVIQLEILQRASLKAIGLLSTRLPDGGQGFSFLIIASVEFAPPLGPFLGVTVHGLGVLVGVHRTVDAGALREGLRARALDAILFPPDPVADAARVVRAVGTVFPPARNRHLIGISAKLGFGNPPLATLDLAVIWERGGSPKWTILGQLHAALPRGSRTKIFELHVDGAGIWDVDRGEFTFDARMYDSRLAFATFGGDVALRTRKSEEDSFVLFSAGGYHPGFTAPAGFPKLDRIRFALADSEHFRLVLTGYVAFTPNTKQFGADVTVFLGVAGFSFECALGFDALFDDDLGFAIDFDLEIKVKYRGRTLLGADVCGRFTGPEPKRIKGEWSVDLWLFSIGKSFDRTFGEDRPPAELPRVDPLPRLVAALRDRHSWATAPPPGRALVTLRSRPDGTAITMHPLGGLAVRQAVVPLGVTIDRFAGAAVPGGRRFEVTAVHLGGRVVPDARPLHELFAPAEFLTLTDDQKLARPSFEAMPAGLALQPRGVTFGGQDPATADHLTVSDMAFEEIVIGADGAVVPGTGPGTVDGVTAVLAAQFGPAARSQLRSTGPSRYEGPVVGPRLRRPGYVVAHLDDLSQVTIPGAEQRLSFTAARQALDGRPDARRLQVVPAFLAEPAP